MPVNVEIKTRRGTAAEWAAANPVLSDGEPGLETDTGVIKYGDGVTAYSSLSPNIPTSQKTTRSATLVVAASNSSAKSKAQADYVCDGTADNVEIQAAINELPSYGGRVLLLEGIFNPSAQIEIKDNNVDFCGLGLASKISLPSSANIEMIYVGNHSDTFNNISIHDLWLDGNKTNQTNTSDGIVFDTNVLNSTIYNCHVTNIRDEAIKISYGCNGTKIIGNKVDGRVTGIKVFYCNNTIISDNNVSSSGVTGSNGRGISIYPDDVSALAPSLNTIIQRNIAHDCLAYGIYLYGSVNGTVSNNICYNDSYGIALNCASDFISCSHNTVANNVCYSNTNSGIIVGNNSYGYVLSSTVIGNICKLNQYDGIQLNKSKYCTIESNTCNNNCQNSGVGNRSGIYTTGDNQYALIIGNTCIDDQAVPTQKGGIYSNTGTGNIITKNFLKNNTVFQLYNSATAAIISHNTGYSSENVGTATITTGQTTVAVSHGLAAAPTKYFAFPSANLGNCWIDTVTATQMTIHCSSAPGVDTPVSWSASV